MNRESMWKLDKINNDQIQSPKGILDEQCIMLKELTDDRVCGVVKEYDGEYRSYESNTAMLGAIASVSKMQKKFDVQTELGDRSESGKFVYEFYLTSYDMPKYKYRVLFLAFGADFYPVEISLDESVAKEIGIEEEFIVQTMDEYKGVLEKILGSEKITSIVKNLYSIH